MSSRLAAAVLGWLLAASAAVAAVNGDPGDPGDQPNMGCLTGVTGSLDAAPRAIDPGESTTLSWSVQPNGCSVQASLTGLGTLPTLSGSSPYTPGQTATIVLKARVAGGSTTKTLASIQVKVIPPGENNRNVVVIDSPYQKAQFIQAIATPNTTVLLQAHLDLSGEDALPIERGVHILGNRSSKREGPRLYTTTKPQNLFILGEYNDADNVIISGIRLDGGTMDIESKNAPGNIGIWVISSVNVDIGNCEIYGFSGSAVEVNDPRGRLNLQNATAVRIHDNFIHHNQRWSKLGYGVNASKGAYALIERNVFDYNRHALTSDGLPGGGYLAYHNLVLEHGGRNGDYGVYDDYTIQFDVHGTYATAVLDVDDYWGPAGEYYDFRYNTITYTKGPGIKLRGAPELGADVTKNVIHVFNSSPLGQTWGDNLRAWDNRFDFTMSHTGQRQAVCDFDADGQADDFWATRANWWFRGAVGHWNYLSTNDTPLEDLAFQDFDGDGRCDVKVVPEQAIYSGGRAKLLKALADAPVTLTKLVWTHPAANGSAQIWQLNESLQAVQSQVAASTFDRTKDFELLGTGDFNGDGSTDLLFRDRFERAYGIEAGAKVVVLLLDEAGVPIDTSHLFLRYNTRMSLAAKLAGIGDFNADGRSDILWSRPVYQNDALQGYQYEIWFAGEPGNSARVSWNNIYEWDDPVPAFYKVKGVADFNGDGYADILWRGDDGQVSYWFMRHNALVGHTQSGGTDPNHEWEIQGIGDFDADGRADLLWRGITGKLVLWYRGQYEFARGEPSWKNYGGVVGQEWQVQQVGDFNADGRADIVWRSSWGDISIWLMNGGWYIGESASLPMPTNWRLSGLLPMGLRRLNLQ